MIFEYGMAGKWMEPNIELLVFMPAPAAPDRDALFTVERVKF